MSELDRLRDAMTQIADIAKSTEDGGCQCGDDEVSCTPKVLPERLWIKAAETARSINPVNAPAYGPMRDQGGEVMDLQRIAVLTSKYWGAQPRRLTVSFMEATPNDLRARIVQHLNAWTRTSGVMFMLTNGVGQVRISRGAGGYYSYLGTDILRIPSNRQTMNLERFTMSSPESEFKRVIRHEAGHTLGFPHEHMRRELVARVDPAKAYEYFWRTQRWDRATVDAQVLTPLDQSTIVGTPADQTSIMCYQLPGSITRDGRPILGGNDINATDYAFAGRIYPKLAQALAKGPCNEEDVAMGAAATMEDDWSEDDDVEPDWE